MEMFLFFAVPMVLSIPLTVLLCRFRTSRGKRVSGGTVLAGALIVPVLGALAGTCLDADFWSTRNKGPGFLVMLMILGLVTITSFLTAGGVVHYYQKRSKRDETHSV
jgi:hypothetical protein